MSAPDDLPPGRRRVLAMLDQRGQLTRHEIGRAFNANRRRWMSTQAATGLAGFLCRPLIRAGWVEEYWPDPSKFHLRFYRITAAGKATLRSHDV